MAERSAEILRGLQQRGFDLCVVSFASSPETQRAVQQKALQFECELIRPFTSVDIVNRKFRSDPQKRPSVCGLITSKAEQVSLTHKQPEEFPLPSLLINICSEALKLFAQGRLKKGG